MRILIVCSCIEPGRDGVGDYTRLLAGECIRLGHAAAIIALNDRHLADDVLELAGEPLTLRLSARAPWKTRVVTAASFARKFAADWVSMQFVGYGFHEKGIVVALPARLRQIVGTSRLHVMMHELWSGGPLCTPRQRLVGMIQRWCVTRMLRVLRPAVLHSNRPVCIGTLAAAGFHAGLLPLFGNIPIADMTDAQGLNERLRGKEDDEPPVWLGGFFGSIYGEWRPEPLLPMLARVASQRGRRLRLVSIGRLGAASEQVWDQLVETYSGRIEFLRLGEQPARRLSQILQLLDFGIPSAPWDLLGKSGAAAAMLDHGLPLLVLPDLDCGFAGELAIAGDARLVHKCDDGALESKLLSGLDKLPPASSLPHVAAQFIECLRNAN